jgi:hypothetical protein
MDLKEAQFFSEPDLLEHWYYYSKLRMIEDVITKNSGPSKYCCDVGAGSGFFSKNLLEKKLVKNVCCVDPSYDSNRQDEKILFCKTAPKAFLKKTELALFMDVLEHVPNDIELLESYIAEFKPGTKVLITVPAYQFLFGQHDRFLGHYRRYTRNQLQKVCVLAGLSEIKSFYYFGAVFPIALFLRSIGLIADRIQPDRPATKSDLKKHSQLTNSVLRAMCFFERKALKNSVPFGLTVFYYGQVK